MTIRNDVSGIRHLMCASCDKGFVISSIERCGIGYNRKLVYIAKATFDYSMSQIGLS